MSGRFPRGVVGTPLELVRAGWADAVEETLRGCARNRPSNTSRCGMPSVAQGCPTAGRSSRHVQIEIDGPLVADTRSPVLLFETRLPVRYCIPRADVRLDLFVTGLRTGCPYKGTAEYCSVADTDSGAPANVAWSYPDPLPAAGVVKDFIAFYNEAVDIIVDGERLERPTTGFTRRPAG